MLGALAGLSFSLDKSAYAVGQTPVYRITGATPNAKIAWTSYLNGTPTGEYQAFYGQMTDANGDATITAAQPWNASHVGAWEKQVIIIPPDYPASDLSYAKTSFTVAPAAAGSPTPTPTTNPTPTPTPTPAASGGGLDSLISGNFDLPYIGQVPKVAVIAGGALLFLVLSGDSGGGRRR